MAGDLGREGRMGRIGGREDKRSSRQREPCSKCCMIDALEWPRKM